jgi:IS605 OrfB family transposase
VLYDDLRDDTDGLHSNLIQKALKDVSSAMSTLKTNWQQGFRISKPEWNATEAEWTMTYDKRAATLYKYKVSLATVHGRVELDYKLPAELDGTPYEKYVLNPDWSTTTSKLVYRNGQYWLHLGVKRACSDELWAVRSGDEVSYTPQEDTVRVLGVDLNVNGNTAVTSTAGFYGNADYLNHRREAYEELRAELQQTATRSAYQRFHEYATCHANWLEEYEWQVINGIVDDALDVRATHVVFEKLDGIRKRISNLPKFQQWMFKRIQDEVQAQLEPYGVSVEKVNPRNTSKGCSQTACQHVSDGNRNDKAFDCEACGLSLNADYNAARNIGIRYLKEEVPASRTCSSGKATRQLALVSGVLSVRDAAGNSEFVSKDWMSTDKPTALAVGR